MPFILKNLEKKFLPPEIVMLVCRFIIGVDDNFWTNTKLRNSSD